MAVDTSAALTKDEPRSDSGDSLLQQPDELAPIPTVKLPSRIRPRLSGAGQKLQSVRQRSTNARSDAVPVRFRGRFFVLPQRITAPCPQLRREFAGYYGRPEDR